MTRWRFVAGLALSTWPGVSAAEVMDKETVPWNPVRLLATLVAVGLCALLTAWAARIRSRAWKLAPPLVAGALAAVWASAAALDDFYSVDVGPAIRAELPAAQVTAYAIVLPMEAIAPMAIVCVLSIRVFSKRSRSAAPPSSPTR
jgi:hypothetical protein